MTVPAAEVAPAPATDAVGEPVDHAQRSLIRRALERTVFAAAGAGSGKTTLLVARVCELVVRGVARLDQVAVITFTEAAAAELRDRVAEELEKVARASIVATEARRAADALTVLDGAAITTLHGFARRILAEHPFEAGVPPTFEVLDEAGSLADLDAYWTEVVAALLDDELTAPAVQRIVVAGVDVRSLRPIVRLLGENWDRVEPRAPRSAHDPAWPAVGVDGVLDPLRRALSLAPWCAEPDDSLLRHLGALEELTARLGDAPGDELEVLRLLCSRPGKLSSGNKGRTGAWGGKKEEVVSLLKDAQQASDHIVGSVVTDALERIAAALGDLTYSAARRRCHDGRLQYHDLLVLACAVVRDHEEVRRLLRDEYRYLLVDEFQDTDPLQAELVAMIAATRDAPVGRVEWWELPLVPGALFLVGDPLQSIYGFRRADIATFLRARDEVAQDTATLVTNFRSVPGVVEWVNAVFGEMVGEGVPGLQPPHVPSVSARHATVEPATHADAPDTPSCPVTVVGAGAGSHKNARDARTREAQEVAGVLRRAVDEGWPVGRDGRRVQLDDIAVLVPTRRSVAALEEALDAAGLAYRLESSSLVYGTAEVEDLLHVLHAVDDPSDSAAIVAALRTPGFGCGDDDLVGFRLSGGSWDYRTLGRCGGGGDGNDPVRSGLEDLRALHEGLAWTGVSELVARVLESRRQLEAAFDGRRWREEWRRLRFVSDQARQFAETSPGGLREYLSWVEVQREEDARVTEVVLPEADAPAVAVMTVHAAKGLEFPLVAVVGLGAAPQGVRGPTVLFGDSGPEIGIRTTRRTSGYDAARADEELRQSYERLRLLYVAVTRAQNHLVVSVHRSRRARGSAADHLASALGVATPLWSAAGGAGDTPPAPSASGRGTPGGRHADPPVDDAGELERWTLEHVARLRPVRRVVSATSVATLAAGAAGAATAVERADADGDVVSAGSELGAAALWRRGRAGTAVGRAVHAVLQTVDLERGDRLEAMAVAHSEREGVPSRASEVATLARVALESDFVRRAASGRYWRELYVGVPVGERVLEGFVDLLFEGPHGLEVLDYKTDRIESDEDVDRLLHRYRLQGAAYAHAVETVTGRRVARCTFLFLRGGAAVARSVPDLRAAMDEVVAVVAPATSRNS